MTITPTQEEINEMARMFFLCQGMDGRGVQVHIREGLTKILTARFASDEPIGALQGMVSAFDISNQPGWDRAEVDATLHFAVERAEAAIDKAKGE